MARVRFAPMKPNPRGLWRRVPPLLFLPLAGLCELALGWGQAADVLGAPAGLSQALSGAVSGAAVAMAALSCLAYGSKLARRPLVLVEDLAILPGRAGLAAGAVTIYLFAALVGQHLPAIGQALLVAGLAFHAVLIAALLHLFATGPREQRRPDPVWQLGFAGIAAAAQAALILGLPGLAGGLFWPALLCALAIAGLGLRQLSGERVPPPLRPLLLLHLAPFALLAAVAAGLGMGAVAWTLGLATLAGLCGAAIAGRWLLAAGPSLFLAAAALPLAAVATAWIGLTGPAGGPGPGVRVIAAVLLVAATLVVLPLTAQVWRDWARGRLSIKSNAAGL